TLFDQGLLQLCARDPFHPLKSGDLPYARRRILKTDEGGFLQRYRRLHPIQMMVVHPKRTNELLIARHRRSPPFDGPPSFCTLIVYQLGMPGSATISTPL